MSDWTLKLRDGTEIRVPAALAETVGKKVQAREPIPFKNRTVLYAEIETYQEWRPPDTRGQDLADAAAAAFGTPVYTDDSGNAVKSRWVKIEVPAQRWNQYYESIPGYVRMTETDNGVMVGFKIPVHQIKPGRVVVCEPEEASALDSIYNTKNGTR